MDLAPADETTRVFDETPSSGEARPNRDENDPDLPLYIGRFYVLRRIGRGGMGQVLLGYDEDLGRKVALKLLRGEGGFAERDRIRREAQALAQLSHPNVVQIYEVGEVGEVGETVYLAMEFVQGELLRSWVKGRTRAEILGAYLQAGHGLAAAHRAGLVHRDFKPSNTIVGRDGRVRVMDFGLARGALRARDPKENTVVRAAKSVLWEEMTQGGSVMGTPAYMAPEQWQNAAIDARTDQFAFCVALWDALYGVRPFAGRTAKTLRLKIVAGERSEPPPGARVPKWLRRVLERGLAKEPDRRWPSMVELLAALESGERRRRLRIAAVVLALVLGAALAGLAWQRREATAFAVNCHAAGQSIDEVWNDAVRSRVRAAFIAATPDFGASTFDHAAPLIDGFVASWRTARMHACVRPRVDPRWDVEAAGRAEECLVAARWSLESSVAALSSADAATVQRAVQVAADLPEVAPCLDVARLSRRPRLLPADVAPAEATQLRRALHAVRSLQAVGRYKEGLEKARALLGQADALAVLPLAAEARIVAGSLAEATSELAQAETWLEEGLMLAAEADEETLVADAAMTLAGVVGSGLRRLDDGLRWGRLARAMVTAQGEADTLRGALAFHHLADVHDARGEYDAALELHTRALEIRTQFLGPHHPEVARSVANIGDVRFARGQYAEAQQMYVRSLEIRERILGPDHPDVAGSLTSLAAAQRVLGDTDAAERLNLRALAIRERTLGPHHPEVAESLSDLGAVYYTRGQRAKAEPLFERSLAILEKILGDKHPKLTIPLTNLGDLYFARRSLEQARKAYARALAISEAAVGRDHVECARPQAGLGHVALRRGRPGEAQRRLERALELFERHQLAAETAQVRFLLAQALAGNPRTEARALELAREAARGHRELDRAPELAEVEAWIARAEAPPPPRATGGKKKKKKRGK